MAIDVFRILAVTGLLILTLGILTKNRKKQTMFFVPGGILLIIYSISIKDVIIIAVQSLFTIAAAYN